jgi:hypothetical protein
LVSWFKNDGAVSKLTRTADHFAGSALALFVFRATHSFLVRCARSCAKVGTGVAHAGAADIARRIRQWFHWAGFALDFHVGQGMAKTKSEHYHLLGGDSAMGDWQDELREK